MLQGYKLKIGTSMVLTSACLHFYSQCSSSLQNRKEHGFLLEVILDDYFLFEHRAQDREFIHINAIIKSSFPPPCPPPRPQH